MKSQPQINFIYFLFFLIFLLSCNKTEEEQPQLTISIEPETEVSETGFKVHWTTNYTDIQSVKVEVSQQLDFASILKTVTVNNPLAESQMITGLSGASIYFYRIIFQVDGQTIVSDSKQKTTSYETESVTFTTSDDYKIAARIKYLKSNTNKGPGIICMHELGAFVNNWNNTDLVTNLIAQGYVCMVFDFRGHGQSEDFDLQEILDDVGVVAPDLAASMNYLKNHQAVAPDKIVLMGGSLGALMSIAGNGYDEVKCTVALSGARMGIYSIFPDQVISNAFFVAGELDIVENTDFAEEASALYDIAAEPKKVKIISGTPAHGTELLGVKGLTQEIEDWVNTCLSE